MTAVIYKDNENLISLGDPDSGLGGLKNEGTGAWVNDATVTLVGIRDGAGNYVAGTTSLAMAYVASSNGRYQISVPDTVTLVAGRKYTAVITAVSGTINGQWEIPLVCRTRTS